MSEIYQYEFSAKDVICPDKLIIYSIQAKVAYYCLH